MIGNLELVDAVANKGALRGSQHRIILHDYFQTLYNEREQRKYDQGTQELLLRMIAYCKPAQSE